MRSLGRIAALLVAATLAALAASAAPAAPLPWPLPGSPPLPPDLTVPYLPGVATICADGADLFGTVLDERGLYGLISSWREESWRNAEQLRHARAEGGVDGLAYHRKLDEIEASA